MFSCGKLFSANLRLLKFHSGVKNPNLRLELHINHRRSFFRCKISIFHFKLLFSWFLRRDIWKVFDSFLFAIKIRADDERVANESQTMPLPRQIRASNDMARSFFHFRQKKKEEHNRKSLHIPKLCFLQRGKNSPLIDFRSPFQRREWDVKCVLEDATPWREIFFWQR